MRTQSCLNVKHRPVPRVHPPLHAQPARSCMGLTSTKIAALHVGRTFHVDKPALAFGRISAGQEHVSLSPVNLADRRPSRFRQTRALKTQLCTLSA
jgi:hypothetical protein